MFLTEYSVWYVILWKQNGLQKSFMLTLTVQKGLDEMYPRIHPELLPVSLTCANGVTMRSSP